MEKEQPSALLARRTRTMKLCSSDARSRGQLGCSVEKWQKRESTRWTRTVEGNPVHPLNVAWHLYSMELAQKSDEEILQIADPIMDNLMQASTEINHERHVRDFTERLKSLVTKDYLEKVCRQYQAEKGYFLRREFVAVFRRPTSVAIVWKQWFTKLQGEFVAEMVLVEQNSRYVVDHVMVF